MEYDEYMDKECIPICDALNELPNVRTFESCCGHLKTNYSIWLRTDNLYSIAVIARVFDKRYAPTRMLWEVKIETEDMEFTPQFCIRICSKKVFEDYDTMMHDVNEMADKIRYWSLPEFYDYFKFNKYNKGMEVIKDNSEQKDEHNTTKCECCLTVFEYNSSELEEEEERDMRGYHYYYYTRCPKCGNKILVKALM